MLSTLLQAQQQGNSFVSILLMLAIVAIFYFFMIRPQQKKTKEQKKFTENVKKGEQIVTLGGIHGRVADVSQNTFILEVERGGRIKFSKSAISMDATKALSDKK